MKPNPTVSRFNNTLASRSTVAFSSMWAFYVFLVYGLMPIFFPHAINTLLYWSNVVQLVALPLLAVGQKVLSEKHDDLHGKVDTLMAADPAEGVSDGS